MGKKLADYLKLHPSTQKLLFAVVQDVYPDAATCAAFGIASADVSRSRCGSIPARWRS